MSRKSNDILRTPAWVYESLGQITLDPCAGKSTNIAEKNWWIGRGEDGLTKPWRGFWFCNPPFSEKEKWIQKILNMKKPTGILLLPERGSAPWFLPVARRCDSYWVMGKKINFDGGSSSNNIGSVMFCFGRSAVSRVNSSGLPGHMVECTFSRTRHDAREV